MNTDLDSFAPEGEPLFLDLTERLKAALQGLTAAELKALWKCNDSIAALNIERLQRMDLHRALTPAILAYEGIQYQYMAPGVLETGALAYLREHLRILSGFYGLLRPFDGVTPYRLEMQARLPADGCKDLYVFWGDRLAKQLACETDCILDLASKEYSRAVKPHLPPEVRFVGCTFGEWKAGKLVEKGTLCKMARGRLVRWLAENGIDRPEGLDGFSELGYRYSRECSTANRAVFVKEHGSEWDTGQERKNSRGKSK